MGSGQYYDPHTGRFLTRGVNSQQTNPYVPWAADPSGMLFAPLALFSLVYGRRKKQATKWEILLLVLLMSGSLALGLGVITVSANSGETTVVQALSIPVASYTSVQVGGTVSSSIPSVSGTPNNTPTTTCKMSVRNNINSSTIVIPWNIIIPVINTIIATGIVSGVYSAVSSIGLIPDVVGLIRTKFSTGKDEVSIEVAAGLAVQGEFSGIVDKIIGDLSPGSSGYGLAQVGEKELEYLGMAGLDPFDTDVAIAVMESRIANAQNACYNCSPRDLIIVAALAQNGSGQLTSEDIGDVLPRLFSDPKAWEKYLFRESSSGGQFGVPLRVQAAGVDNYKQLLLLKYVMDLRVLNKWGWDLPEGITTEDLDYLENLARGKQYE